MTATVAALTRSAMYMDVIIRQGSVLTLLDAMMDLLEQFKDNLPIQESCCIAIVCICGHTSIDFDSKRREQISHVFFYLSQSQEPSLLCSILSGILVLAERGVTEMLSLENLQRVTEIARLYSQHAHLTQICCAIFRLYSYRETFIHEITSDSVLDFLFAKASSEDLISAELAAVVICNLAYFRDSCRMIVQRGLIQLLPSLSCQDPLIQDIYVRCMCNISAFEESKEIMLRERIPQTILMIALVRSVSNTTKRLCLKVLLNILDTNSIPIYVETNVVRAFSGLSTVSDTVIQVLCAKGFLVMTSTEEGRKEIAMRRPVLMALFNLIQCADILTKNMAGVAVYNILCCEACWETVALSGGIALMKVLVTADSDILREASAQALVSLIGRESLHPLLVKEPLLHMMVEVLRRPAAFAFEAALCSLAYLSHFPTFRTILLETDCATILLAALMSGSVNTKHLAEELIRCLYFLSFETSHAVKMIGKSHVMLTMHFITEKNLCSTNIARMMTFILRNLSYIIASRETLVEEDALTLLLNLLRDYPGSKSIIFSAISHFLFNLSKETALHDKLMSSRVMDVVRMMVPKQGDIDGSENLLHNPKDVLRICATVNMLSSTTNCHQPILDGGVIDTFSVLLHSLGDTEVTAAIENEIANCICNVTSTPKCRELLNRHCATNLLLQLSTRSDVPETQKFCSIALSRLSESEQVEEGMVSSFLLLSLKRDERANQIGSGAESSALQSSSSQFKRSSMGRESVSASHQSLEKKPDTFQESIRTGLAANAVKYGMTVSPTKSTNNDSYASKQQLAEDRANEDTEKGAYSGDYKNYRFVLVKSTTWIESGGLCEMRQVHLTEANIQTASTISRSDRKNELEDIPLRPLPLPKESKNAEMPRMTENNGSRDGSLVETSIDSVNSTEKVNAVYDMP